jgi:hypothetical protein
MRNWNPRRLRRTGRLGSWSLSARILAILLGAVLLTGAVLLAYSVNSAARMFRAEVQSHFATTASAGLGSLADLLSRELVLLRGVAADPLIVAACEHASAEPTGFDELEPAAQNALWRDTGDSHELVQEVVDPGRNPVTAQLLMHLARSASLLDIIVTESSGVVIGATARPDDYDQSLSRWWSHVLNQGQGPYVGTAFGVSQDGQAPRAVFVEVAVPILAAEGGESPASEDGRRFAGAVRARLDLGAWVQSMAVTSLSPLQHALVTDAQGTVLAASAVWGAADLGRVHASWFEGEHALSQGRHSREAWMEDRTLVLLGYSAMSRLDTSLHDEGAALSELDWILFVYQPTASAYREVDRLTGRIVVVGLVVMVAAVIATYLAVRRVAAPLERLADFVGANVVPWIDDREGNGSRAGEGALPPPLTAENLQAGHGPERASVSPHGEAGVLAQALNRLLDEQESLLAVLRARDLRDDRERRRRQRDEELTTSIGDAISVARDVDVLM